MGPRSKDRRGPSEVKERRCLSRPYQPRKVRTVRSRHPETALHRLLWANPRFHPLTISSPYLRLVSHLLWCSCGWIMQSRAGQNHLHNSTASLSRNPTSPFGNGSTSSMAIPSPPGRLPFGITNKVFPNKVIPNKATVAHHYVPTRTTPSPLATPPHPADQSAACMIWSSPIIPRQPTKPNRNAHHHITNKAPTGCVSVSLPPEETRLVSGPSLLNRHVSRLRTDARHAAQTDARNPNKH